MILSLLHETAAVREGFAAHFDLKSLPRIGSSGFNANRARAASA